MSKLRKSKELKLSTVPKRLGIATGEVKAATLSGVTTFDFSWGFPRSLNGIFESKKSAEWRNEINDEKREWTDSPKQQES
jgi:hypothetical protein